MLFHLHTIRAIRAIRWTSDKKRLFASIGKCICFRSLAVRLFFNIPFFNIGRGNRLEPIQLAYGKNSIRAPRNRYQTKCTPAIHTACY